MFVIKVGEYYVNKFRPWDGGVILSKELMTGYDKKSAETIAKKLNGEVIKITEEVVNE